MPLPTYQQSGLLSQPTARLDFAAERETERSSQMMAQSLDRLSDFAFKEAAKQAIREGEQWAYNNPITPAQLDEASKGLQDLSAKIPKAGTFFGDSARKIQAGQLRADLELAARSEIADVSRLVEAGQITSLAQLDDRFYGISKGYGKFIAKIDPEQASQFSASIATAANSVYISAAKRIGEITNKQNQETVIKAMSSTDMILRNNIATETDPVKLDQMLSIERKRILDKAALTNDPVFFSQTQKQLDTMQEKAYVHVIAKYAESSEFSTADTTTKFQMLQDGEVGKYKGVWAKLQTETREKIIDQFYKREGEKEKFRQDDLRLKEKENKIKANEALDSFYKGEKTAQETIDSLITLEQANPSLIKALRTGDDRSTATEQFIFGLEQKIALNEIGENDLRDYASQGRISWKEANRLGGMVRTQDKDLSEGKMIINRGLGITDPFTPGLENEKKKSARLQNQLVFEYLDKRQKGESFDVLSRARQLVSEGEAENKTAKVESADQALTNGFGKLNVSPPPPGKYYTEEELRRGNPNLSDKDIKRLIRLQNDARDARK